MYSNLSNDNRPCLKRTTTYQLSSRRRPVRQDVVAAWLVVSIPVHRQIPLGFVIPANDDGLKYFLFVCD
jgi:hypothetical protein